MVRPKAMPKFKIVLNPTLSFTCFPIFLPNFLFHLYLYYPPTLIFPPYPSACFYTSSWYFTSFSPLTQTYPLTFTHTPPLIYLLPYLFTLLPISSSPLLPTYPNLSPLPLSLFLYIIMIFYIFFSLNSDLPAYFYTYPPTHLPASLSFYLTSYFIFTFTTHLP